MEEIVSLVQREIYSAGCDEMITAGIILCGGGSLLRGTTEIVQQVFNLPVRIGTLNMAGGEKIRARADLATALGLISYGTKVRTYARFHTQNESMFHGFLRRVNEWFGDHD